MSEKGTHFENNTWKGGHPEMVKREETPNLVLVLGHVAKWDPSLYDEERYRGERGTTEV